MALFRRSETTESPTTVSPGATSTETAEERAARTAPKGRPTPTRKEAEAAARARARTPRTRKELAAAKRRTRAEESRRVRTAMKTGDEKHMLPRDRGPERRLVRDLVDSRFSFLEVVLPIVLVTTVLTYSGNPSLVSLGSSLMLGVLVLILVEVVNLRFRLRRELERRFPGEAHKGTTWYAVSRSIQMRFMRLPKTQVKISQKLPEHYR